MLPKQNKYTIIISEKPIVQFSLNKIIREQLSDYEINFLSSIDELTQLQLRRTTLILADLSGEIDNPRIFFDNYCSLMIQNVNIHWIFIVKNIYFPLAIELLMKPETTLLLDTSPVTDLIEVISAFRLAPGGAGKISLLHKKGDVTKVERKIAALTPSEIEVLRLFAKGWGGNQIAAFLKKSNKTISAQKSNAMRRLSLHNNAELYAWITSTEGVKSLYIDSYYG
ncbi:response regulator transcription factor [Klebsiella huaxiensis]|uniref:LuxR C-terminal-related transcriptional regulator n=1 Tax=Klebsiella huaxiensis TaxID=2153354 RepID=A0ABT6EDX4_9ENTR|nr:LuxR C-terminal-related transcriptional regulator [Klebsiella huaxiensis]MDG1643066.1 LuxR C-terminal-related transcriptional regulator [Klebsiella huaxiensis]QBG08524.1 response regulator transcription factor [Klebsiella huaxiensis]VUS67499.1 Putative transcription factor YjjQ [Klebsiella huaxiensis]